MESCKKCVLFETFLWLSLGRQPFRLPWGRISMVREEPEYIWVFAENKTEQAVEYQRITANHKTQTYLKLKVLVLFCVKEDAKSGFTRNCSLDMHLRFLDMASSLGPGSCFSPSWIPLRLHCSGWLQWLTAWLQVTLTVYLNVCAQSRPTLWDSPDCTHQAPLPIEYSSGNTGVVTIPFRDLPT